MEKQIQVVIKDAALKELAAQYDYYANNYSIRYAEKFRLEFFQQVKSILPQPLHYPECRFLPTKNQVYRNIVWGNYLIVYKVKKHTVEVLVLFHTKQHQKKLSKARRIK